MIGSVRRVGLGRLQSVSDGGYLAFHLLFIRRFDQTYCPGFVSLGRGRGRVYLRNTEQIAPHESFGCNEAFLGSTWNKSNREIRGIAVVNPSQNLP